MTFKQDNNKEYNYLLTFCFITTSSEHLNLFTRVCYIYLRITKTVTNLNKRVRRERKKQPASC